MGEDDARAAEAFAAAAEAAGERPTFEEGAFGELDAEDLEADMPAAPLLLVPDEDGDLPDDVLLPTEVDFDGAEPPPNTD